MPRAAYMICAEDTSFDRATNAASYFKVVEAVSIKKFDELPAKTGSRRSLLWKVVAVWQREDTDAPDEEFAAQIVAHLPNRDEFVIVKYETIFFRTSIHRVTSPEIHFASFPGPGLVTFECRLRKAKDLDWQWRQQFSLLLIDIDAAKTPTN